MSLLNNEHWKQYEKAKPDVNGRIIHSIHSRSDEYIIYFCKTNEDGSDPADNILDDAAKINGPLGTRASRKPPVSNLYYECSPKLLETTADANAQLAIINRLVSDSEHNRREVLELAADAFEMLFLNQKKESLGILSDITQQLTMRRQVKGQLNYLAAVIGGAVLVWAWYGILVYFITDNSMEPLWLLAGALASTGGILSVCLNLSSIKIDINQSTFFVSCSGGARFVIALLSGIVCYLAIGGRIILGFIGDEPTATEINSMDYATPIMLFFFLLSGFSETFIPNVLKDAESKPRSGEPPIPAS